jgi:hypothetical protein
MDVRTIENTRTVVKMVKNIDFCLAIYSLSQYHLKKALYRLKPKKAINTCKVISKIPRIPYSETENFAVYSGIRINPINLVDRFPKP